MSKKRISAVLLSFFILGIFGLGIISASGNVAYIYKSKTKIDTNVVNVFNELNLSVSYIPETNLTMDFSNYNFIFVGDESFSKEIPIYKYRALIYNYPNGGDIGITDRDGVSKLFSIKPLNVMINGSLVQVYTKALDYKRISIPYYFLDKANVAPSLKKIAGTFSTSSGNPDIGDVIATGAIGNKLMNGKNLSSEICFFGIIMSDYWTTQAKDLFKQCVGVVNKEIVVPINKTITCYKNSDCGVDHFIGEASCNKGDIVQNFISFKCNNNGTSESFCSNSSSIKVVKTCPDLCSNASCLLVKCSSDKDCDDGNNYTDDICLSPDKSNSSCMHDSSGYVRVEALTGTSTEDSVTLSFSANPGKASNITGFFVGMDLSNLIFVSFPTTSYTFNGLTPSTTYLFYARAIDNLNRTSPDANLSISTQTKIVPPTDGGSGGGGGGGGSSGSSSYSLYGIVRRGGGEYCLTTWNCTGWSICNKGLQTRTCSYPTNWCKPYDPKPNESQSCVSPVESPVVTEVSVRNTPEVIPSSTPEPTPTIIKNNFPITGAAVGAAIRNSWLWILVLVILAVVGYITYKKMR